MAVIEEYEEEDPQPQEQGRKESTSSGEDAARESGHGAPSQSQKGAAPPAAIGESRAKFAEPSTLPEEQRQRARGATTGHERDCAPASTGNNEHQASTSEVAAKQDQPGPEPSSAASSAPEGAEAGGGGEVEGDGYETASDGGGDTGVGGDEDFHDALTEEEQQRRAMAQAEEEKAEGNALYSKGAFEEALQSYSRALKLAAGVPEAADKLAVYHSNSAICHIHLGDWEEAVKASSEALKLNPSYVKALVRRAQACEHLDRPEDALADLKKVVEIDPHNRQSVASVRRLEPVVAEKQEKMKEEMLGKLKELGNSILGHFGMSVDNFQAVKDPATGSYSINFQK